MTLKFLKELLASLDDTKLVSYITDNVIVHCGDSKCNDAVAITMLKPVEEASIHRSGFASVLTAMEASDSFLKASQVRY